MKNFIPLNSGRRALAVACLAITPFVGQVNAAPDNSAMGSRESGAVESGTIPQARPGLPQLSRGAEGPVRLDMRATVSTDPSVRDSNPLTMNGLWEMRPGNEIATSRSQ